MTNPIASPKNFAAAYADKFGDVVRTAAQTDDRLSQNEAKVITDGYGPYRLPVEKFFMWSGQQSVDPARITRIAQKRAEHCATEAVRRGAINPSLLPEDLARVFTELAKTVPARKGDLSFNELFAKADDYLRNRLAPARGWDDNLNVEDWGEATHWGGAMSRLDSAEPTVTEEDLIKIDFAGWYGDPDLGKDFSVGIAMDRRDGEILRIFVGREGASNPDDL